MCVFTASTSADNLAAIWLLINPFAARHATSCSRGVSRPSAVAPKTRSLLSASDTASNSFAPIHSGITRTPTAAERIVAAMSAKVDVFNVKQIGRASCRGKSVDLGGRRIIKKKKKKKK